MEQQDVQLDDVEPEGVEVAEGDPEVTEAPAPGGARGEVQDDFGDEEPPTAEEGRNGLLDG